MELLDLLKKRHSTRQFLNEYVLSKEEKEKIKEASSFLPSAMHRYPLKGLLYENKARIAEILERKGQKSIGDCSALFLIYGDSNIQSNMGFLQEEAGAMAENILLMATSLSLASCWLGVHENTPFLEDLEKIRDEENLAHSLLPLVAIALGKEK